MTMQIFTKLLTTNIVANNRSTSPNKRKIASDIGVLRSFSCCISLWVSEKNDVSAPDANAEIHSRHNAPIPDATICGEKSLKTIHEVV